MKSKSMTDPIDTLRTYAVVQERPFTSNFPIFGPLIVRFRTLWNNMATRWYVLSLLEQQNQYNLLLAETMSSFAETRSSLAETRSSLTETRSSLTETRSSFAEIMSSLDKEGSDVSHQLAELTTQVIQMNRLLQSIDQRLKQVETESS